MFNWLRELIQIRLDYKEQSILLNKDEQQSKFEIERDEVLCYSCETLKMQLSIANQEKKELLNRLLKTPEVIEQRQSEVFKPVLPKTHLSFNTHRQMLEKQDREKAKLVRQNELDNKQVESNMLGTTNQASEMSVEDLERELGVEEAK